jgi:hypothetical protein
MSVTAFIARLFGKKVVETIKEQGPVIMQEALNKVTDFQNQQKTADMNNDSTPMMVPASDGEENGMQVFQKRPWAREGYEHGLLRHSTLGYKDGEAVIKATYNQLCMNAAESCRAKILKNDHDLTDIGPQSEFEAKAQLTKKFWQDTLTHFLAQRSLDHALDHNSGCHLVIMTYRSGYNSGWQQYLFNTGE